MRVFLIGFMGAGKSKKGRKLASLLGYKFIDQDEWIVNQEQESISTLFNLKGEEYFRQVEYNALQKISALDNVIVATGGGSPCYSNAIDLMNDCGITIYLEGSPLFLKERLLQSKKERPLIKNLTEPELEIYIETKLKQREPFYLKAKIKIKAISCKAKDLAALISK